VSCSPELDRSGPRGGSFSAAVGVGLAGLLAAVAIAGCSASTTSPGAGATPSPRPASPTPTSEPTKLQPPAAPTELSEWMVDSEDQTSAAANFKWTPPPGPIGGYYFWVVGVYVDADGNAVSPPPAICGPSWETIPASATTHQIDSVESDPEAYICAFNAAGTSPTVQFPMPDVP